MRKIILLYLVFQLSHSLVNAQIGLAGNITTLGVALYPTHIDSLGKGGYMVLPTIEMRNNIPTQRRKKGMMVYVQSEDILYKLNSANLDNTWIDIGLSSSEEVNGFLKYAKTSDSLFITKGTRIDEGLIVKKDLTVAGNVEVAGNVNINNELTLKGQNVYNAIEDKLNKSDTASLSNRINLKLNIADTSSMLTSRFARDTISLSKRIDKLVVGSGDLATLKLNIIDTNYLLAKIDTANMLSSRFKRDTANLSYRLDLLDQATFVNNNLKLNIDDTSYLLQKKDTITLSNRIDAIALSSNVFTSDITLNMGSGKTFGKYSNGQTIPSKGKSIDDVIKDIVTLAIPPSYSSPGAGLSMGSSGVFEIGTNLGTLTYSPNFEQKDGGNFTSISYKKNGVEIANNAGTPIVTDNLGTLSATTTYQVVYTYSAGTIVKKNNLGIDDPTGMRPAGSVSASVTLTPSSYRYWGMTTNSSASLTDADIRAMVGGSKEFSDSKLKPEFTITGPGGAGPVKYAFYAFPTANTGTINSIKAGGFESKDAFDVITRDFVNAQGYTVNYTIYVQKNSGTDNVTLIISQ